MQNLDTDAITQKLDRLIRLVALGLVDGKKQREQIDLLARSGLPPREIADLLGTTANTVSVTMVQLRRGRR
jgi:DNA-binding CsgD family transcriptional regulator